MFLVTYAGHGGQVPDTTGDEVDGFDETWCLFDGQLIDDELFTLWTRFRPGVRILMISDSCHSGTAVRAPQLIARESITRGPIAAELGILDAAYRRMPRRESLRTYRRHREFYNGLQASASPPAGNLRATVRSLSACQDNQFSLDGDRNGLFTGTLLVVWDDGLFKGTYGSFHQQILELMPPNQSPNHLVIGPPSPRAMTSRPPSRYERSRPRPGREPSGARSDPTRFPDPVADLVKRARITPAQAFVIGVAVFTASRRSFFFPLLQGYFQVGGDVATWRPDIEALVNGFILFPTLLAAYVWQIDGTHRSSCSSPAVSRSRTRVRFQDFMRRATPWFDRPWWVLSAVLSLIGVAVAHLWLWDPENPKPVAPWWEGWGTPVPSRGPDAPAARLVLHHADHRGSGPPRLWPCDGCGAMSVRPTSP